jgi:hypothetical protein
VFGSRSRLIAIELVALALSALGCADPRYPEAQFASAVALGTDRYWVVGRYGFAAEGRGPYLHRADFPETSATPEWAWESMGGTDMPGGHVVELVGRTYLFTAGSEVFRRDPAGWSPVAVRFSTNDNPPGEDQAQINQVLVTPTGDALVHVHATELYWVDGAGIERGLMKREKLPHFFTWLGFVHGTLHGVGWEGDDRAVFARADVDQWTKVVVFPKKMGQPEGVVPLEDGRVGVVVDGALVEVGAGGSVRVVPISELVAETTRRPLVVAGDAPAPGPNVAAPEPLSADPDVPTPSQAPARTPNRPPDSQGARQPQILAPQKEERRRVQRVLGVGPDRYALGIATGYGSVDTLVILGESKGTWSRRVVRCDILGARRPIGVIEADGGTVYVPTHRGSVVEIRTDGACGESQPPLLPDG